MKRIIFTFIMGASTALMALPNEPGLSVHDKVTKQEIDQEEESLSIKSDVQNSLVFSDQLEAKKRVPAAPRRDKGSQGVQGPKGNPGGPGVPGPEKIIGSGVYGSFYTTQEVTVNVGQPILFTNTAVSTWEIAPGPGLTFLEIERVGDYLVTFGVSATGDTPFVYALVVNGVVFADGSNGDSIHDNQMTTISTTVSLTDVSLPVSISVINNGTNPFTLSSATSGDLTAFITIKLLNTIEYPLEPCCPPCPPEKPHCPHNEIQKEA
jgi:hypothetical protein